MSAVDSFDLGDIVFVGEPAPLTQKVTWRILRIDQAADGLSYATLSSGQTDRLRTAPLTRLHHFRLMETTA